MRFNEQVNSAMNRMVESSTINWDEVRKDFNMVHDIESYSGTLYHGTELETLIDVINNDPHLYYHSELSFDAFSVSDNREMLHIFGEMCGLSWEVTDLKIIRLDEFYYDLLACDTGMSAFWDDPDEDDNGSKIEMAKTMGLVSRFGGLGIDNADEFFDKVIKPLGVDGVAVPGFEYSGSRQESEIAIVNLPGLMGNPITYIVDEQEYDDKESTLEAIQYVMENN